MTDPSRKNHQTHIQLKIPRKWMREIITKESQEIQQKLVEQNRKSKKEIEQLRFDLDSLCDSTKMLKEIVERCKK